MCLLEGRKSVSNHGVQCFVFFVFWPHNSSALLALVNASLTTIFLPLPSPCDSGGLPIQYPALPGQVGGHGTQAGPMATPYPSGQSD